MLLACGFPPDSHGRVTAALRENVSLSHTHLGVSESAARLLADVAGREGSATHVGGVIRQLIKRRGSGGVPAQAVADMKQVLLLWERLPRNQWRH